MLKALDIRRMEYGPDKGKFEATIKIDNQVGAIEIVLTQEQTQEIVAVVGEELIEYAKQAAEQMTELLVMETPALLEAGE